MSYIRPRITKALLSIKKNSRNFSAFIEENDYTKVPEYPPITDVSQEAAKSRAKQAWHDKIMSLKTVEEKLFAVNMPKYYGWHTLLLNEGIIPYNSLPLTQFITRTHLIDSLPECYSNPTVEEHAAKLVSPIRSQVEDALKYEYSYLRDKYEDQDLSPSQLDNIIGSSVTKQINRILLLNLSPSVPHLLEAQIDFDPRIESFWFVGQIDPPAIVRRSKEKVKRLKDDANKPIDRCVQYIGSPCVQLRSEKPLPQYVELKSYDESELTVPTFTYDPRVLGVQFEHRHGTNIPGFWPGDESEFGIMSYHNRGHILDRPPHYGEKDLSDCLKTQAILGSYGWTLAQACYQGFSTFNDLTYPLVSQSVITNGQIWSFYAYQLNTTLLHSEHATANPRRNICWATSETKLFEAVDEGTVIGFNDDVLKTLIKFYLNEPQSRDGIIMKPYLDKSVYHVAHIADIERRTWLEKEFKHMYSNRPRHRLPYEVYDWERIYKIQHNSRPLDKKTRPFEFRENPYRRTYDEQHPRYIPKKFRPEDKKHKNKWSKTFYP